MTTYSNTHDGLERVAASASWLGDVLGPIRRRAVAAWARHRTARRQARQDRLFAELAAQDHRLMAELRAAVWHAELADTRRSH